MTIKADDTDQQIELPYMATNFLIAPQEGLPVKLTIGLQIPSPTRASGA